MLMGDTVHHFWTNHEKNKCQWCRYLCLYGCMYGCTDVYSRMISQIGDHSGTIPLTGRTSSAQKTLSGWICNESVLIGAYTGEVKEHVLAFNIFSQLPSRTKQIVSSSIPRGMAVNRGIVANWFWCWSLAVLVAMLVCFWLLNKFKH